MPKPGDLVASKYVIEQILGEGGMGAVFAATHRFTGKQVAIKWMLPELARDEDAVHRFMREAQAAGRINHPNVVDVYDVGQHEDSFFLVMELLRGEPLTSALSRRDLTVRELLDLLLRAMRGVAAAHRQGVVHRDLKPDNIFLAYEDDGVGREPKVLDFGISKVSNEGQKVNPRLTRTGAVVGTPYYMSPEQIRGSDSLDRRADVYAFGVILYEALTGQVPFIADTYGALVLEIATGTPKLPDELVPGLPGDLSRIVMRAMARNAPERFPDMESLIHALEPYLHDVVPAREPTGPHKRLRSSGNSPMSTPFTAEPPAEDPALLGIPNGRSAMYIALAIAAVAIVWFAVDRLSAPDASVIAPGPVDAAQPEATLPRSAAAVAPIDPASLPSGASTPREPFQPVGQRATAAASDSPEKSRWGVAAKSGAKANLKPARPVGSALHQQLPPAAPASEKPVQSSGRRARSGPLSVDEF